MKPEAEGVVFESAPAPTAPRYRLTYISTGAATARLKFEIAPPGKDFASYIEASLRREKP